MKKRRDTQGDRVSATEIARRLSIDSKTALRWLREPGGPQADERGRYSFAAASKWIARHAPRAVTTPEFARLRERLLALRVAAAEREDRLAAGKLIEFDAIKPQIARVCTELTRNLQDVFERELPYKYAGRSAAECLALNEDGVDRVITALKAGLAPVAPTPEPATTRRRWTP